MTEAVLRAAYHVLLLLAVPVLLARLLWRSRREPGYREAIRERLGLGLPQVAGGGIWLHAASAGEVGAGAVLLRALHELEPSRPLIVSCTTPAGRARAARELADLPVTRLWLPWDLPSAIGRALDRLDPRLLILVERELWPNLLEACAARAVPVLLADGRLSASSAARYEPVRALMAPALATLTLTCCESEASAQRLAALGVRRDRLLVAGSLKLDAPVPPVPPAIAMLAKDRWLFVAGSTQEGEESRLLAALDGLWPAHPELLLVLAPRRPERFDAVAGLLEASGLRWRRIDALAAMPPGDPDGSGPPQVLLLATVGDLPAVWSGARAAFVGGSWDGSGGHGIAEPARAGVPVLTGPDLHSVEALAEHVEAAGGLRRVGDAASLGVILATLLGDEDARAMMGERARDAIAQRGGALAVTAAVGVALARDPRALARIPGAP